MSSAIFVVAGGILMTCATIMVQVKGHENDIKQVGDKIVHMDSKMDKLESKIDKVEFGLTKLSYDLTKLSHDLALDRAVREGQKKQGWLW